ncbi:ferredoxin-thioredoxin reductase catalytic chain, chloroplastic [Trifolium repens]|jgi:hypothetical protein|nr:ferredoxin-thioredoxin reductase catalytic chain, chloroplastic [Trifolium repens]
MKLRFLFGSVCLSNKKQIKDRECTLITTAVTPLSEQKYVPDLRAYCSENFLIISMDLSDGSTERTSTLFL